jgi:cytochrome c oxidase subunit 2
VRRARTVALVVAVGLGATSCGGASILDAHGSESDRVAGVWWVAFGLAAFVYVVVAALIVVALTRGRRRRAAPSRLDDNLFIWIGGVIVPVAILAVVAVLTVDATGALRQPSREELHVEVTGKDWWWAVRYPDGGVVTANELHLPAGQSVDNRLNSDDVIHSFWVPQLAGKEDVIPGQPNHLRFTPETAGTYARRCAEFCGLQHAHMGFRVIVESPADFGRWLARRETPRSVPVSDEAAAGATLFGSLPCAGCHTVRGTSATGRVGPDLSDVGSRQTIGADAFENTPENLARWISDAPSMKPGVAMPSFHTLSARDVAALVAYLESLK